MSVSEQQARAIAFLAAAARPHGARRWDEAGIYANIMKVADRSLATVTIAVMQAAEDRNAQSPGVIPTTGPHWRAPEHAPAEVRELRPRYDPRKVCNVCGLAPQFHETPPIDDHAFLSIEAARAVPSSPAPEAVRQAIADRPRAWPSKATTNEEKA